MPTSIEIQQAELSQIKDASKRQRGYVNEDKMYISKFYDGLFMLIRKTSTKLEQMVSIMHRHFEYAAPEDIMEIMYKYKFAPMMYQSRKEQAYMEKSNPRIKKPIR